MPEEPAVPDQGEKTTASSFTAEDHYPAYRWIIIGQLWLQQLVGSLLFSSIAVLLPGMRADLSFGALESGWLGSARSMGQILLFPVSILLVRFAPNRLFGLFALLVAAATALIGLAGDFSLVLLGMVLSSLGSAFIQVPINFIRMQWVPQREFATVWGVGMAVGASGMSAGLALIPLVLGILGGWRGVFLAGSVLLLSNVVLWTFTARERITERYRNARSAERGFAAAQRTLRRREFYLLGVALLGGMTSYITTLLFIPTYLVQERGFSLELAGSITAVMPLSGLFASLSAGYLSDRIGRRKPFIWPAGLILPACYLLMLSPLPPAALVAVAVILGYVAWAPFPPINTIPFELPGISPSEVAIGQSLMTTVATVGVLLGPVAVGGIAQATGSYRLGLLTLCVLPILFTLVCLVLPETGAKAAPAAKP